MNKNQLVFQDQLPVEQIREMNISELLDWARNDRLTRERRQEEQTERARLEDEKKKASVLGKFQEFVGPAIGKHLVFGNWHQVNYETRNLWNAEIRIEIPNFAPIRIYLRCFFYQPEVEVRLHGGRQGYFFDVIDYYAWGDEFEPYARERCVSSTDDLLEALLVAQETGNHQQEALAKVQEMYNEPEDREFLIETKEMECFRLVRELITMVQRSEEVAE